MSLHKIQIIGHVGRDAIVREHEGRSVIGFNVAVTESYTDKAGIKHESTTWYSCAWWREEGRTSVAEYIRKGVQVYVEGVPKAAMYTNKQGAQAIDNTINVRDLRLLSSPKDTGQNQQGGDTGGEQENDLPF